MSYSKIFKSIDKGFEVTEAGPNLIVTHNGGHFETIPKDDLTREKISSICQVAFINKYGNMIDFVEANNEQIEAANERKQTDINENFGRDIFKTLRNDYYYGG